MKSWKKTLGLAVVFLCIAGTIACKETKTEEEKERLTENIKIANLQLESAYLNENIFGKLEDKESLLWNYFDKTGEIQIGWTHDGTS